MHTPAKKGTREPNNSHTVPPTTGTMIAAMWLMVCSTDRLLVISSSVTAIF